MKHILFSLFILSLFGCKNNSAAEAENVTGDSTHVLELSPAQLQNVTISFTEIQNKEISQTLRLNGSVDVPPQNMVSVSTALGGYLKSTKLLPGMHFRKGEVLAVMEDNQYIQLQQDYLTTNAQLEKAEAEYLRQKELNENKASSDKVFQQAKAEFQTLQVSQKALEEKLRLININPAKVSVNNISRTAYIYAPFDGYVTRVLVNTGKYISPSDVMFELVDPRDLHLHLKLFEKDLGKISTGKSIVAYTNSNPGKKYEGEIILIGKNLSEDRAVDVHAHFNKYDESLIPGLYMNADIDITGSQTTALPDESVVTYHGSHYVFLAMGNDKFEMTEVLTGSTGNGWTEIQNAGELAGKKIVQSGAYTMLMALKNKGED